MCRWFCRKRSCGNDLDVIKSVSSVLAVVVLAKENEIALFWGRFWRQKCNVRLKQISSFRLGHSRRIEIPDCVQFSINTNACRGYCESYAVPSAPNTDNYFRAMKPVTSVGQCCNIMETEDVNVMINCLGGPRNITFKSATKCSCYNCKKD